MGILSDFDRNWGIQQALFLNSVHFWPIRTASFSKGGGALFVSLTCECGTHLTAALLVVGGAVRGGAAALAGWWGRSSSDWVRSTMMGRSGLTTTLPRGGRAAQAAGGWLRTRGVRPRRAFVTGLLGHERGFNEHCKVKELQ